MNSKIEIRLAEIEDLAAICSTKSEIFDNAVNPNLTREFLKDPRHHLALAFEGEEIVGMASAVHYIHPDKKPELFINEAGVDPKFQNQQIGRRLIELLCGHGRTIGCTSAWVLTDEDNSAAQKAYQAAGGKKDDDQIVLLEFDLAS